MKLGVLIERFDPAAGGAEAHTAALVQRAHQAGDDVELAFLECRGELPPFVEEGIEVTGPRRRPARDRVFADAGVRALRDLDCDVVLGFRHCPGVDVYLPHGGLFADAVAAWDRARGGASRLRRWRRRWSPKHRFFRETEEALLGRAHGPRVVCVSHALAARTRERYPASAGRLRVVPNGADLARFDPEAMADIGRTFRHRIGLDTAYVGLLVAHHPMLKGARTVLEALALPDERTRTPPFHLLLVGGRLEPALRRLARRLGVLDRVHETGPVTDARPFYAAADVLVHPTYYDPCSLACLEALAMALPVVTTPQNGVAELMGGRGGIVLEGPGRPDALATALGVLADEGLREATARDARSVAEAHPLERSLDQLLALCREAAR